MNDFVFNVIFEREKEKAWVNSYVFRVYLKRKYGILDRDIGSQLYIAINKYQVNKYGSSIQPHNIRYKEDYLNYAKYLRQMKYRKKK